MSWEDALWRTPLAGLVLLAREEGRTKGDNGMTLEDIETIDRMAEHG